MKRDYDLASTFHQQDLSLYNLKSSYINQFEEACLATIKTTMTVLYRQFLTSPCSAECKSVLACSILS